MSKYNAIVYDEDMNDVLKNGAEVVGTYEGMYADKNGRYSEMSFSQIGFDFPVWKKLRDQRLDIDYIDDQNNFYSLEKGRCNNMNYKIKMKDAIQNELDKAVAIKEQMVLRDKYAGNADENGIAEYLEKKAKVVPSKKAACLVAVSSDEDLVLPFREVIAGNAEGAPLFIYLHDKRSRGTANSTMLLKECKNIIATIKGSGKDAVMLIPNVVMNYGQLIHDEDGDKVLVDNALTKLLHKAIDYEVKTHNIDTKRIYIMGVGTGVDDVLNELELHNDTYAGAVLAFGTGYYDYNDDFKDIVFEVVSASQDVDCENEAISNMAENLSDTGAKVNYQDLDGKVSAVEKAFYKNTEWLENIFNASR